MIDDNGDDLCLLVMMVMIGDVGWKLWWSVIICDNGDDWWLLVIMIIICDY